MKQFVEGDEIEIDGNRYKVTDTSKIATSDTPFQYDLEPIDNVPTALLRVVDGAFVLREYREVEPEVVV